MQFKWHNPGCPCCGCPEYEDDFNRADNDDLGSKWEEKPGGVWDIYSNQLRNRGSNVDDMAIYKVHPPKQWVARVDMVEVKDGDVYRMVFNADLSFNYTHYAEVAFSFQDETAQAVMALKLFGGTTVEYIVFDASDGIVEGNTYTLTVCYTGNENGAGLWSATLSSLTALATFIWDEASFSEDKYIGLQTGTANETKWDNFHIIGHYLLDPTCPDCYCSCEGHAIPKVITATIENLENCPRHFGVTTFYLTYWEPWDPSDPAGVSGCEWRCMPGGGCPNVKSFPECDNLCEFRVKFLDVIGGVTPGLSMFLLRSTGCESGNPNCTTGCGGYDHEGVLISYTCSPLVIVFEFEWDAWERCDEPVYGSPLACEDVDPGQEQNFPNPNPTKHRKIRITLTE